MRANPGGQIPPSEVVGRDALIQHLWRILERQSLVLSSERRMGKTCIARKMEAEALHSTSSGQAQEKLPLYRDLERVHTPLEFTELVLQDVEGHLSRSNRVMRRARQFLSQLGGMEVGGILKLPSTAASHWKALLTRVLEDLVEDRDRSVIFLWDEMPIMLHNIRRRSGEDAAMELLDTLRSLRQMHRDLRMVFTGSIGFHNALISLRRVGYANDPTNDMDTVDVPPLSPDDARELARRLLEGENLRADVEATARAIAEAVDGIPYFIHHIVDQLAQRGGAGTVGQVVEACLTDPLDRWHLHHYRSRIDTYYTPEERPFALGLLDVLAIASGRPLAFDEAFNLLKSRRITEDDELAREVLTLLQRDHYVAQQADGAFRFRFPLIQRYWRMHRGLR